MPRFEQPEIIVDSPVEGIAVYIRSAYEAVLDQLEAWEVDPRLGAAVKIKHIPESKLAGSLSNMGFEFAARANLLIDENEQIGSMVEIQRRYFESIHGLELGDAACEELFMIITRQLASIDMAEYEGEGDDSVDIFVYGEVPDYLDFICTLLHETWHLIEQRHGILNLNQLIHEGTATYVQRRCLESNGGNLEYSKAAEVRVLYKDVADLVEKELGDEDVAKILEPEFRQKIVDKFNKKLLKKHLTPGKQSRAAERKLIMSDPSYAEFREDPTRENLLEAMRKQGFIERAKSFEQQDMTGYLEYVKSLIQTRK